MLTVTLFTLLYYFFLLITETKSFKLKKKTMCRMLQKYALLIFIYAYACIYMCIYLYMICICMHFTYNIDRYIHTYNIHRHICILKLYKTFISPIKVLIFSIITMFVPSFVQLVSLSTCPRRSRRYSKYKFVV